MTSSPRPNLESVAAGEIDQSDLETLHLVAGVYEQVDPVPGGLVDRIQFGITLDALHAEIAQLQRSGDLVGVRGGDVYAQTITFTSAHLTTMVTVTEVSADRVRVDGWIAPGGGVVVELRLVEQTRSTTADPDGRFVFADVPRGLAQFRLTSPAGTHLPVLTPSIQL